MATATPLTPTAEPPERIRHPLERLRGTIRRYVTLEGALAVALFLALWFWIGLALDLGSFKLFGFDWVQEWPRWIRGGLLSAALAGLAAVVITKLIRRLTVDFRPRALALVLEHTFPETLGDRLITAVELADLDRAESQGYSRAMIAETVREAGDRVADVPVHDVFDWGRLKRQSGWVSAAAFLPFVLFGIAYSAVKRTDPREDFLPRFRETAVTWLRRDVLLQNVIWPRKAYLEVLDFPESGDLRVGRDAPSPRLRIKARRWVFADAAAPEGWRAMTWADLTPALVGGEVPALPVELLEPGRLAAALAGLAGGPVADVAAAGQPSDWTLDRVNIALEDSTVRQRLADHRPDIIAVFDALTARAAEPGKRSTLRRLEVPERVEVRYWGVQTSNRMELLRGPGWEYAGTLGDLKESVKFWARGADYYTATRSITLVPPPALQQLKRMEFRPAYLYHRPPTDGGPPVLRGLRQRVEDLVSLNGATSRFAVPEGTDLVLEGQLDKDLQSVILRPRSRATDERLAAQELALGDDRLGFRHRFERIAAPLDFDLEFTDTDGVKSSRHVVIDAVRDLPPIVNVIIDGIRKTNQGPYLATPIAMIPFEGKVIDGLAGALGGLDRVDYTLTLSRVESSTAVGERAAWLAAALLPAVGGRDQLIVSAAATAEAARVVAAVSAETTGRTFPLATFQQRLRDLALRDVPLAELTRRLELPPGPPPLVRELVLQTKFEFLDLRERLPDLKARGEDEVQPRYRMKLTVTATDNNIETGPGVAANKEPPFTVLVVSEAELLVEIARDEEALHLKTEDAVARLREARQKLETVAAELSAAPADALPTFAQRSLEVAEAVVKARDIVQEVSTEYNRILRELELNRVSARIVEKVKGEICLPLESALRGEFVRVEEALEAYRKELDAARKPDDPLTAQAKDRLDRLIAKLAQVMAAMGDVTTINKLINALREIEKGQEQAVGARLRELQRLQREKLLEKLKGLDDKKE
jgi:hypothetical protein